MYASVRMYVCMYLVMQSRPDRLQVLFMPGSCLLPDLARGLLQAVVALLVRPAGAEAGAHDGGPRPALEQED